MPSFYAQFTLKANKDAGTDNKRKMDMNLYTERDRDFQMHSYNQNEQQCIYHIPESIQYNKRY